MTYTLAIDPGVKILGWALFFGDRLVRAGLSETKERGAHAANRHAANLRSLIPEGVRVSTVAVELMTSYDLKSQKGDQNDLIALASIGSYVAGIFRPTVVAYLTPSQWKGQLPKDVSHRRIEDKLSPAERSVLATLPPPTPKGRGKRHNAMDAIGIGLCHIGRRA